MAKRQKKPIDFFHGFTSCPEQFRELGEQFFEQGYNVYIPRMPHHGHADQLSDALLNTSSEELAAFATESIDIARGLGDEVTVGGLSGGGTITAWIAQERNNADGYGRLHKNDTAVTQRHLQGLSNRIANYPVNAAG